MSIANLHRGYILREMEFPRQLFSDSLVVGCFAGRFSIPTWRPEEHMANPVYNQDFPRGEVEKSVFTCPALEETKRSPCKAEFQSMFRTTSERP
jgi:hypothetical protein